MAFIAQMRVFVARKEWRHLIRASRCTLRYFEFPMSVHQVDTSYPSRGVRIGFPANDSNPTPTRPILIAWSVAALAFLVALGPWLFAYARILWSVEHYQFVPVLIAAAAWLAWTRWQIMPTEFIAGPESSLWRGGLWSLAVLAVAATVLAGSPLLAMAALLITMLAGLYEWGGARGLRYFLPVWAVLLLTLRPPFQWDQQIIVSMQRMATSWASGILDSMNIHHMVSGVVIQLPGHEFFVAEACSGVHSLFAALAFVAVYGAIMRRSFVRVVLLLLAAVFWVLVGNIIRVWAVVILSGKYGLPVAEGLGHELLGILVFGLVVAMVLSFDRLMLFLLPARDRLPVLTGDFIPDDEQAPGDASAVSSRNRVVWAGSLAAVFITLGIANQMVPAAQYVPLALYAPAEGMVEVPQRVLPETWNGWKQVDFVYRENDYSLQGPFSRIWRFEKGPLLVALSIDGPFPEWHNLETCYKGLGYNLESRTDHDLGAPGPVGGGYTEMALTGGRGRVGHVLFMAYSDQGRPVSPPAARSNALERLMGIWEGRTEGRDGVTEDSAYVGRVYQVQVFMESNDEFTEAEVQEMHGLYHEMRERIAAYVAKTRGKTAPAPAKPEKVD